MQTDNKHKLGIFIWFGYRIPVPDRARLIREAGFETVLHWWDDAFVKEDGYSKEEQVSLIRREGLIIENAHLRTDHINDLWLDTQAGQAAFDGYLSDIDGLAEHEIPVAVLHLKDGTHPPPVTAAGMKRFRQLVRRAEKRGVRIAIENVSNTQALMKVLDSFDSPMLGFCYDSGHDYIWSKTPYELLGRYKDRVFAVHLHDNMGQSDDHLPPGEGKINWDIVRTGIENSSYTGSYTLESDSMEIPVSRTPREHLKMHYDAARAIFKIQQNDTTGQG